MVCRGSNGGILFASLSDVTRKPDTLTHPEAASIPIGGLTAWQGLFNRAQLQRGERVLVHGGAGAVGGFAIQLARWRGAEVITTASNRHRDTLLGLGAQQVIDYRSEQFEDLVHEIDVVFDGVGGKTLEKSWDLLAPQGRVVTIAASSEQPVDERTRQAFFIVQPDQHQLEEIVRLLNDGKLRPMVDAVVPFDRADEAYQNRNLSRSGCGKIVVQVIED